MPGERAKAIEGPVYSGVGQRVPSEQVRAARLTLPEVLASQILGRCKRSLLERSTAGDCQMDAMDSFVDGRPHERTCAICLDLSQNLAKVRVKGSNPVVRSNFRCPLRRRGASVLW
jgi:hypothetical protein